jgi:hypothetical protein
MPITVPVVVPVVVAGLVFIRHGKPSTTTTTLHRSDWVRASVVGRCRLSISGNFRAVDLLVAGIAASVAGKNVG